jgi:hypothetical protein
LNTPLEKYKGLVIPYPLVVFFFSLSFLGAAGLSSSLFTSPAATAIPFARFESAFLISPSIVL